MKANANINTKPIARINHQNALGITFGEIVAAKILFHQGCTSAKDCGEKPGTGTHEGTLKKDIITS